ncbi:MAG: hypothetical protein EOP85_13465, partial [Verrucomicrobiaceae bacterium]
MVGARDGGASTGTVNHTSGTLDIVGGQLWLGQNANDANGKSAGTYNLNGGILNVNDWIGIGREGGNGTLKVSGGTLTKNGAAGTHMVVGQGNSTNTGLLEITGGLVDLKVGQLWVGENSAGTATLSGTGQLNVNAIQIARDATTYPGLLQLNGGTLRTGRIFGGVGVANAEFNGTTIIATANQTAFIEGLDSADIKANGFTIDTNGFSVAVGTADNFGQVLTGTGGITKLGAGTLTLNSPNTYAGATTVSAGKLAVSASSLATGAVTVANGATFGVNVAALGQKTQPSALTLGSSNLDIDVGATGNTIEAPLDIAGTLTLNGTAASTLINVSGTNWFLGQFPLIGYDTLAGTGGYPSIKLGTLPVGMTATLVHNTANKTIDLNVTRLNAPTWTGLLSDQWNTTENNWRDEIGGNETNYANGDSVSFRDDPFALDIQIPANVTPGAYVLFANEVSNYSLAGAGKITGTTRLIKQLAGSVTLNTAIHDFTGGVRLEGGSTVIGALSNGGLASPIGAASADPANL